MPVASVDGRLVEPTSPQVTLFDHGLVTGDGIFETLLVTDGHPFALQEHLDRLERSAAGLELDLPDRTWLVDAIEALLSAPGGPGATESGRWRLRITITAGDAPLASSRAPSGQVRCYLVAEPAPPRREASAVAVVPFRRNEHGALTSLKTISYAENVLALRVAARSGADEAIFANISGDLCEGTGSNVFYVRRGDGRLCTPSLSSGCLAGVTRGLVLSCVGSTERDLPIAAFHPGELSEAFLCSTMRGVQPIASIDGVALEAAPGPLTSAAAAGFAALADDPGARSR